MKAHFTGITGLTRVPSAVVVIDVLRAFTTASWAFAGGADRILLAASLEEARELKARRPELITLKDGPPAPGFDLVNSPALLRSHDLTGRVLAQKTTNGTVGAHAAGTAPLLLCAAFTVAAATAAVLRAERVDQVTFVVTGRDGRAEEDLACAEYIAELAAGRTTSAAPYLRRAARSKAAADIAEGVRRGHEGVHPEDVPLCLEADRFPFAMAVTPEDGHMTLRRRPVPGA
ncbi:2-phosphosulfolactate phosphatase [Streptomyces sp. NPDC005648]|uniref:2-phosphosulfolactate phosphatase n=1 Tax=Streptomyces sp. NPDC005648 TaxID=3157044 RepID=UPI0033A367DD